MKGNGIFFNMLEDLERFIGIADKIEWIAPIMAPDQSSVQHNRKEWAEWRRRLPNVKFLPWLVCDDPEEDADNADWIAANYEIDGMLFNAEKAYEGAGKWKASVLVPRLMENPKIGPKPKILSHPSTPAEIYNMDFRTFERAGFVFAPQAYWLDPILSGPPEAYTPKALYDSVYLPKQLHVGWDYRIQISGIQEKHWARVVSWDGGTNAVVRDIRAPKLYRLTVIPKWEGDYPYFVVEPKRALMDYKTGKVVLGKILGFQASNKIYPTVGYYPKCEPTPLQITAELQKIRYLKGASLYLGETSGSEHVKAVWTAIQ